MDASENRKVPMLLHYLGTKNFSKLCDYMDDKNLLQEKYDTLVGKCIELFQPKVIEVAEVYKFNMRKQTQGESVQD